MGRRGGRIGKGKLINRMMKNMKERGKGKEKEKIMERTDKLSKLSFKLSFASND